MKLFARVLITIAAFIVSMFFLGLLRMSTTDKGAIVGLLSGLIIFGLPWLVWWATGKIRPADPGKE